MIVKKYIISFAIISSFFFSGCGLYVFGVFGTCDHWEIYSEEERSPNAFKMHVCGTQFGYAHTYLDRKKLKDIREIVYPKLKKLVQSQISLDGCIVKKESITFGYGIPTEPIEADIICERKILFERKEGRFFLTSFPFN